MFKVHSSFVSLRLFVRFFIVLFCRNAGSCLVWATDEKFWQTGALTTRRKSWINKWGRVGAIGSVFTLSRVLLETWFHSGDNVFNLGKMKKSWFSVAAKCLEEIHSVSIPNNFIQVRKKRHSDNFPDCSKSRPLERFGGMNFQISRASFCAGEERLVRYFLTLEMIPLWLAALQVLSNW